MIRILNKYKDSLGNAIYIGRHTSPLGNPFVLKSVGGTHTRDESVDAYEAWLRQKVAEKDPTVCTELNRLFSIARRGDLDLWCFCSPARCHGDVIKRILEEKLEQVAGGGQIVE